MNKNKIIANNTLYLYIKTLIVLLISLYISRAILEILGVSDFGVYNVVAGFVLMFELLSSSLSSSVQRYYNYEAGRRGAKGIQDVYVVTILIQILISVIVVGLAETVGLWYLNNKMVIPSERLYAARIVFHLTIISLVVSIMQVPYISVIYAKERMFVISIIGIIDSFLKLIAVFSISLFTFDNLILYSAFLLSITFFDFISYFIYSRYKFRELRIPNKPNCQLFFPVLRFTIWSAISGFANVVKNQGINIVLNFYFGPVVNAARGISYQIKSALLVFMSNIGIAARPQLIESYAEGNINRSLSIMYSISKISFFAIFIPSLPIIMRIDDILTFWLGCNIPDYTNIFAVWVILITLVDILISPLTAMIYANGNIAKYNILFSIIGLSILPIAILTFTYYADPVLVFIESSIVSLIQLLFSIIIVVKLVGMPIWEYFNKVVMPLITVMFLSMTTTHLISSNLDSIGGNFIFSCICAVLICICYIIICGLNHKEKTMLKTFFKIKMRYSMKK